MAEYAGQRSGTLSPQSRATMQSEQRFIDANRHELDREALAEKAEIDALIQAYRTLKHKREARGVDLSELAQRTGIDQQRLTQLDNDPYPNPTLSTLMRIAEAIEAKLTLTVTENEAA